MQSVRLLFSTLRLSTKYLINRAKNEVNTTRVLPSISVTQHTNYSTLLSQQPTPQHVSFGHGSLLSNPTLIKVSNEINSRNVTKYSLTKGKRKTVNTVLKRFYRLNWGGWIRTIAGRHRRIYKKKPRRKIFVQQHVLCNATQSRMLDAMVNMYWKRPKYYVDDPYEPYHTREEFSNTYKKPKPYFPPEELSKK